MLTETRKQDGSLPIKKSYSSPLLIRFGSIGELTAGGTGAMAEMGMSMSPTQHP